MAWVVIKPLSVSAKDARSLAEMVEDEKGDPLPELRFNFWRVQSAEVSEG